MNEPRISLCELTIPDTTFERDVDIAVQVGAHGLGIDESKVIHAGEGAPQRLRDAGLGASIGIPRALTLLPPRSPGWDAGSADPAERLDELIAGIRTIALFNPDTIMVCTGPQGEFSPTRARSIVVDGLRAVAQAARDAGTRVSIEPMRESFRSTWTMVSTLREGLMLLDEVGRDDVGLIFDTWHLWDSAEVHQLLPEVVPRVHAVQVCDYRNPTRGPMDRVVAGDGMAGIDRLLRELLEAGYAGWFDLECLSDDGRFGTPYEDSLWKLDPQEFARRQVDGFLLCWARALA